jgi:hypothetical protein
MTGKQEGKMVETNLPVNNFELLTLYQFQGKRLGDLAMQKRMDKTRISNRTLEISFKAND